MAARPHAKKKQKAKYYWKGRLYFETERVGDRRERKLSKHFSKCWFLGPDKRTYGSYWRKEKWQAHHMLYSSYMEENFTSTLKKCSMKPVYIITQDNTVWFKIGSLLYSRGDGGTNAVLQTLVGLRNCTFIWPQRATLAPPLSVTIKRPRGRQRIPFWQPPLLPAANSSSHLHWM